MSGIQVAALFVRADGPYANRPDVDAWTVEWEQTGHLVGDRPFAFPWHTLPSWEPVRQAWLMAHDGGTVERRADSAHAMAAIMASAESCGEAPVRAAIQSALITWALGEEVGP